MVAMVAIDDRTRFASSHHQPEAHEWISACLRVHRCGLRVPQPTSEFLFRGLAEGVAMVAMVAIDDRTRANQRRGGEG